MIFACIADASEAPSVSGMTLDLSDEEAAALAQHPRQALDYARYPFAHGSIRSNPFWRSLSRRSRPRSVCRR